MKNIIFAVLLMLVGSLASCEKKETEEIDQTKAFLGKWRLVKNTNSSTNQSFNYFFKNIVIEFKKDGFYSISDKNNHKHYEGRFISQVKIPYNEEDEYIYALNFFGEFGSYFYRYRVSSKELIIGDVDEPCYSSDPVDCNVYYFVKIH